jgi:hypothetical protein
MKFLNLWLILPILALSSEAYWIFLKKVDFEGSRIEKHDRLFFPKSGMVVGQTFLARHDYLSGVRLFFLVPDQEKGITIEFHLQRVGRKGREYDVQHKKAVDNGWVEFRFEPISNSGGYVHHFYVATSEESEPPVAIALADNDVYPEGQAYGRDVPADVDLLFQCLYSKTIYQSLDRTLSGKPGIFGSQFFLMTVFIAYNLAIALFCLWLWLSSRQAPLKQAL